MRKRIAAVFVVCVLALLGAGCAFAGAPTEEPMMVAPMEPAMDSAGAPEGEREYAEAEEVASAAGSTDGPAVERLIIRNASLSVVVPDTEEAVDEIQDLVEDLDGYVVSSRLEQYQEGWEASMTLRIPAESLDQALERVRELATEVRREQVTGEDVTEDYVDLQSYLRHRQAVQERLLEYLEEAEDVEEALAVDQQLRQIEAEIERAKGRIQYLEQAAAMATVNLSIVPDELAQPIEVGGWHPEGTAREAFETLIHVLQFVVDALIVILIVIVPTVIVVSLIGVGLFQLVRAIVRRLRGRKVE